MDRVVKMPPIPPRDRETKKVNFVRPYLFPVSTSSLRLLLCFGLWFSEVFVVSDWYIVNMDDWKLKARAIVKLEKKYDLFVFLYCFLCENSVATGT